MPMGIGIGMPLGRGGGGPFWNPGDVFSAQFSRGRYMINGQSISAANLLDVTRATSGWASKQNGQIVEFGSNLPRITNRGLRVEEARDFASRYSNTVGGEGWSNGFGGGCSVTMNALDSPFGPMLATKLESIDNADDAISLVMTLDPNTEYSASVFIKAGTSSRSQIKIKASGSDKVRVLIDWAGSVPSLNTSLNASNIEFEDTGFDGYYRLKFTFTSDPVDVNIVLIIYPDRLFSASGKCIYLTNMLIEEGGFVTSPMIIEASTLSRDADDVSSDDVSWLDPQMQFVVEWNDMAQSGQARHLWQIDDGSNANRLGLSVSSTGRLTLFSQVAGAYVDVLNILGSDDGLRHRAAITFDQVTGDCRLSVDGSTALENLGETIPGTGLYSNLRLGQKALTSQFMNGDLIELTARQGFASTTELEALSAL